MTVPIGFVAFTVTITNTASGPFSLYSILSGNTPSGITLGASLSVTYPAKGVAFLSIQNMGSGTVYLGDSTVSSTNSGLQIGLQGVETISPGAGASWVNGVYFNASANSTVLNIMVVYQQ